MRGAYVRGLMCACSSVDRRRDRTLFLPNPELNTSRSSEVGTRDRRCNNTVITAGSHHHFPSDVEGGGAGGANGVGCEGWGQEVCRVLPFSPLCPGLEPASMGILPVWISVCAIFILTSCEEQRIPEGEWVSPVLRTVPGSQEPCPGLCWIELDLQSCQTEKLFRPQEKVTAVLP